MVRVAILVEQNWNPVPGGTARSINRLVEALVAQPSTEVVGVHGRNRGAPVLPLPAGIETVSLPLPGRLLNQMWNRSPRPRLDRWIRAADVVHGPAYVMPGTRKPGVVTVHDLAFVDNPEWFTPHGVRYLNRFLERLVEGDEHVIVPSGHTAADCRRHGIADERISVVPWGSDPANVSAETVAETLDRHGVSPDAVLFVGTIEPRKNLDGLLAAMRRLPDRQLVVVGPSGWGEHDLRETRVLGSVSDDEVAALMAGCAVVAYPSHFEGFGLPVLEAMGQGTPVVVTAGTAPAEVAGDGGVAVDSTDPAALAEAIDGLLRDADHRHRLGENGRLRAAEFSWETTAELTAHVYRRVLE